MPEFPEVTATGCAGKFARTPIVEGHEWQA
jgi:hypothetical protein